MVFSYIFFACVLSYKLYFSANFVTYLLYLAGFESQRDECTPLWPILWHEVYVIQPDFFEHWDWYSLSFIFILKEQVIEKFLAGLLRTLV